MLVVLFRNSGLSFSCPLLFPYSFIHSSFIHPMLNEPLCKIYWVDQKVNLLLSPEGVRNTELEWGRSGQGGFRRCRKMSAILFLIASRTSLSGICPFKMMLVYNLENLEGGSLLQSKVILEVWHQQEANFIWGNKPLIRRIEQLWEKFPQCWSCWLMFQRRTISTWSCTFPRAADGIKWL